MDEKDNRIVKVEPLPDMPAETQGSEKKKGKPRTEAQMAALKKGQEALRKYRQDKKKEKYEKKQIVKEVATKVSRKARERVKQKVKDMSIVEDDMESLLDDLIKEEESEVDMVVNEYMESKYENSFPKKGRKQSRKLPELTEDAKDVDQQESVESTFTDAGSSVPEIFPTNAASVSDKQMSVPLAIADSTASIYKPDVLGEDINKRLQHLEETVAKYDKELERTRLIAANKSGFLFL